MRLKYNILWVDDHKDDYIEIEMDKNIEAYIKGLFLDPSIDFFDNVGDAEKSASQKHYDVIFSDYNIDEKTGRDLIIDIRNKHVNAEVLFYSAQQDPPLLDKDRISFFRLMSNTAYATLEARMKEMIDLTLEKLNDLTSLRGLVMAEVSELDEKMENLIAKYYVDSTSEEKRLSFNDHIVNDLEKSLKKRFINDKCEKKCIHSWRKENFSNIIPRMDSSQKARTIKLIMDEIHFEYNPRKANFYEDFLEDVISVRNALAHCVSCEQDGKEILKTRNNPCVVFSQQKITDVRKNLQKYSDVFKNLTMLII